MNRCRWVNPNNPIYIKYHDEEWGRPCHNDHDLFELLILESFQAGLSWECVLNKREAFRKAYDNFDVLKVSQYGEEKKEELMNNRDIVRNRLKIKASIENAKIFIQIQKEFGSFDQYIWSFSHGKRFVRTSDKVVASNELSDQISKDLSKRGMKFVGTVIIYSYLQAIGILQDHDLNCDLHSSI